jgi:hypothetical protein
MNRPLRVILASAALAVGLSACSQDPSKSLTAAPNTPVLEAQRWHFGSQHYRDRGHRRMHNSSGMAAVDAEALFGHEGTTTLEITSFRTGDENRPAGDIERVLVRIYDPNGKLVSVRSIEDHRNGPTFTERFRGLGPGFWFQLSVLIDGIDRKRSDLVIVPKVLVVRRPDVAITGLSVPAMLVTGSPTILSATIAELNGDHGATADCLLSLDGAVVDRARGIWVDAGDAVSCAFTWTFLTPGTHHLAVRLDNITPADDNTANNARALDVTVQLPADVVGLPTSVSYSASIRSGTFTSIDSFRTLWTTPSTGFVFLDAHEFSSSAGSDQSATISGIIGSRLAFPLSRVELRQASGSALIHSALYTDVPPDNAGNADCIARGVGTGTEFYLCSDPSGFTSFTYRRATGTVTYMSDSYQKVWNGSSYDVTAYVDNGTTITTGTVVPFGSTFTFDVRITNGAGSYIVSALVPLAPLAENDLEPSACTVAVVAVPPATYSANTCVYSSYVFNGVAGSVSGLGAVLAPAGPRPTN